MPKPLHSKPFDLGAAKAGAPFCGANGEAVRVLIWDRKHPTHPILAIEEDGDQEAVAFAKDGSTAHNYDSIVRQLVMLPLGLIDDKPVFVGDEIELKLFSNLEGGSPWKRVKAEAGWAGTWKDDGEWARWPAPPKVYPETRMTTDYLFESARVSLTEGTLRDIANAALRHAVDAGQVFPLPFDSIMHRMDLSPDAIDKQIGAKLVELGWLSPEARATHDMAVAKAVIFAACQQFDKLANYRGTGIVDRITRLNLTNIIAKVPQ